MRKTPLRDWHAEHGARFVDFFGWEMPVQYTGILDETRTVRAKGGLFDLCHMGRLEITGPDREALVERVFSGKLSKLKIGRAKYGFLLNEQGYPLDDVLVYRDTDLVHMVINATGRGKDPEWIEQQREAAGLDAQIKDCSDEQAMIALQGRISEHVLQPLCDTDLSAVRYYGFANVRVDGTPALLARTGYTGEDGFELFFDPARTVDIWQGLMDSGKSLGIQPIGLGARDLLRLEAGMPLYGQEITPEIHPLEADLSFGVAMKESGKLGVPALQAAREAGLTRTAISLTSESGRVPRAGCPVFDGDTEVGVVTSGGVSPTVEKNIARALVQTPAADIGATLDVEIRKKRWPMTVVAHPFYKRPK